MAKSKIAKVTIRNFRSVADVTVTLNDLTVLVGLNASGKSNFLDALKNGLDSAISKRKGMSKLLWAYGLEKSRELSIAIDLVLDDGAPDGLNASYNFQIA